MFNLFIKDFTLVNPRLDADEAIGGVGFGKTEVDVGTQGLKRHAAVTIPFGTGDFSPGETAGAGNLDAFGAELAGHLHGALHGTAEGDAAFQLHGDVFGNELGFDFRTADFVHLQSEIAAELLLQISAELFNFSALAADDAYLYNNNSKHVRKYE